ncbi:hypothetical protein ACFL1P_01540 [Patescibacteria group bacterium]
MSEDQETHLSPQKSELHSFFDEESNPESGYVLIRNLDAQGILNIFQDRGDLNSLKFEKTSFHLVNTGTDAVGKAGYGSGGSSLGSFIVLPEQIRRLGGIDSANITSSQVGVECQVPTGVRVTYDSYLFVTPDELDIIIRCKSREEALQVLGDREPVIESTTEKANKHLEAQKELVSIRQELHDHFGRRNIESLFIDIAIAERDNGAPPVELEAERGSGITSPHGASILMQNFDKTQVLLRDYRKVKEYLLAKNPQKVDF